MLSTGRFLQRLTCLVQWIWEAKFMHPNNCCSVLHEKWKTEAGHCWFFQQVHQSVVERCLCSTTLLCYFLHTGSNRGAHPFQSSCSYIMKQRAMSNKCIFSQNWNKFKLNPLDLQAQHLNVLWKNKQSALSRQLLVCLAVTIGFRRDERCHVWFLCFTMY